MVRSLPPTQPLTPLERQALLRAIVGVKSAVWREALMRQVDALCVTSRTEKTAGYYIDFEIPSRLRIEDLSDEFNKNPPQAAARHPDGANAVFFVVYIKDGVLSFMEAASTADWPNDEDRIVFVD